MIQPRVWPLARPPSLSQVERRRLEEEIFWILLVSISQTKSDSKIWSVKIIWIASAGCML